MNIHNITNIRLCSTVQPIVRYRSTASDTETAQETTTRGVLKISDAMFARQPAVDGLGDEGPGQRSRWIAGPTQVTRTSAGCRHSEAVDVDDDSSVAGRDLQFCIEPAGYQFTNVNRTVHQRLRTHTVQSAGESPTYCLRSSTVIYVH